MVREYTTKLVELVDNEVLSAGAVFSELMCYLSEAEIKEFCLEGFGGEIAEDFKELGE